MRPGGLPAPEAYSLMPVIAALLFEFCLREMRQRTAGREDRKLNALRWLRPAELVRVRKHLAADAQMSAGEATRQVRVNDAARRLYQLRILLLARDREAVPAVPGARRIRHAERRAYRALIRAGFTESAIAFAVLRQVQVMTQTRTLALLDYDTPDAARAAIGSLISSPAAAVAPGDEGDPAQPGLAGAAGTGIAVPGSAQAASLNGHRPGDEPAVGQRPEPVRGAPAAAVITAAPGPETSHPDDDPDGGEEELVAAARRLVADARQAGARISQIALAEKLRSEGYKVANNRLRWLAAVSGMESGRGRRTRHPLRRRPVMTVPGPATPADPPGQDKDREQRLAALGVRLHEVAGQIRTAGDWDRCLRAAARLHGESWANVLLISSRVADATVVKGYQAWQGDGRQVSREEKGIEIFSGAQRKEPGRHDPDGEDEHRSWRAARRVAYVWDVSQTSGQPVQLPSVVPAAPAEAPGELWDCLCWMARREGFAVEREDGCPDDGATFWAARRIRVLPGLPASQAAWALAHQLGHVLLHNTITYPPGSTTSGCQGVRRAEADSVAFIVTVRYGIPAGHVFSSPQTWAGRDPRAQPGRDHPGRRRAHHHGRRENHPRPGPAPRGGRADRASCGGSDHGGRPRRAAGAARRAAGHRIPRCGCIAPGTGPGHHQGPRSRRAVLHRPGRP